jgi:hypothetical protein
VSTFIEEADITGTSVIQDRNIRRQDQSTCEWQSFAVGRCFWFLPITSIHREESMNSKSTFRFATALGVLVLAVGIAALLWPAGNQAKVAQAYAPAPTFRTFLPFISKMLPGISGSVNLNGAPAAGVSLNLQFYNGTSTATAMTTNTHSDGGYQFLGAASLAKGQHYYVQYSRPSSVTDTLRTWSTASITTYVTGGNIVAGNFDIADIPLVQPSAIATVTLPATFQWTVRPATPSDNYFFELKVPSQPTTWTSPALGYVGTYVLSATLPTGFTTGVQYQWFVKVTSPDGGTGTTSSQKVTFQ